MGKMVNLIILALTAFISFVTINMVWAGNATSLFVEISYPCHENQINCDTGAAVSREVDGDKVNVYITLIDAAGNPATAGPVQAGPAGESLETLTASCSSILGSINPNHFAADAGIVSFNGDATARAIVDYTGSAPGVDQIICFLSALRDPIIGTAYVNVATSSSVVIDEPTEEATAIVAWQEGPQTQAGVQTTPCGEAIVQIFANGTLSTAKNIEINFGEGSVEGAELRTLESDQPLPIPLSVTLNSGDVKRYVVFSPILGFVDIEVKDLGSAPLDPALLLLHSLCYGAVFVEIFCDEYFLCPGLDCLTCEAFSFQNEVLPYTWELNGEVNTAYTGDSIEICPNDLDDGYNTLTVIDTTYDVQDTITIEYNTPDLDCPVYCGTINVSQDTVLRSRWFPSVALITVNGSDTLWELEQYTLEYTPTVSRDLFILPGTFPFLGVDNQTINQLIIILPAWWSGCCFDGAVEIMTVTACDTVRDCCVNDTVEIDMLTFILDEKIK